MSSFLLVFMNGVFLYLYLVDIAVICVGLGVDLVLHGVGSKTISELASENPFFAALILTWNEMAVLFLALHVYL